MGSRLVRVNGHHYSACYVEIGLYPNTVLGSIVNITIDRVMPSIKEKKASSL